VWLCLSANCSSVFELHGFTQTNSVLFYFCNRVLDNLKDYAVRALVNAVDHLGTVAYKLTDLLEQQTLDVSTMDLKVSMLNQVIRNIFLHIISK